ncbi:unnamed protein product, partial [Mesorhabditis belari]|uniref:Fatty acid hydroxylase domain-containing protein n=1 Tax=Mesorhabditis belari TaxID=2138241 RepID=A0AAF3ECT4_9BILA
MSSSTLQDFWDFSNRFCNGNDFILFTLYTNALTIFVYLLVNIPFVILDFIQPAFVQQYKIQGKKYVTWEKFASTFPLIVFNSTVVALCTSSLFYVLGTYTGVSFAREVPSWLTIIRDMILAIFVEEFGFYYTHRLLHQPFFYKRIHKIHHRWTAPISITSVYCHPLEHALSNLTPVLLGPTLVGAHVVTFWIWFTVAVTSTTISHCGYDFLSWAPQHDYHHAAFNENFGVLGLLDTIHGTNTTFRKSTTGNAKKDK